MPVGWEYETGLSPTDTTSPNGWSANLVVRDENEYHSLQWKPNNLGQGIPSSQSLGGFSVALPVEDVTYQNSNINIIFEDGLTYTGVLSSKSTLNDFDGDGKSDQAVFRPSDRVWYLLRSGLGFTASQFGISTDKITPADFDGDGRTDIAVFRDGFWYWLNSSDNNFSGVQFGQAGDVPVPADYSGDGHAELR